MDIIDTKETMKLEVGLAELEAEFEILFWSLEKKTGSGIETVKMGLCSLTENPVTAVISFLVNFFCCSVKTAILVSPVLTFDPTEFKSKSPPILTFDPSVQNSNPRGQDRDEALPE